MKKLKHFQNRTKSNLTFMILPNSSEKIIKFSLPKLLSKVIILSLFFVILSSIIFSSGYFGIRHKLIAANNQIAELKLENESQKYEIAELKNYSIKVDEKLADLNKIQNQVLNMVGLDTSNEDTSLPETTDILFSYSYSPNIVSRSAQSNIFSSQGYEEEINLLTELIDREKENMEKLILNVEQQLEYLDALPNLMPNPGRISSPFGYRISPTGRNREFHNGIDISNKLGTDIIAAGSGIVTYSGYNGGYGKVVMISHGYGYTSIYAHNQEILVSVGDQIEKGQVIAKVGSTGRSTGPHVHFEVRLNNEPINPLDLIEN
ncbi:M23 family metallopeptidase [Alkaliphilus sp. MSJ-5]|uniref:M23 family metallopeptidase n=1 Tax=Alkaliphilus flagellatus TaxID=2841507 RepID=A0ABS6G3F7_9FIRM|nr:M23 family metallopeptidase [Alkaliphilus flagellatus]MBU5675945.1 M23 family metallopeptidase [Alkaliphilus flagellatus]